MEMRADLMVRTGDQLWERVSRQMAPLKKYKYELGERISGRRNAYRLTADIRVPYPSLELHGRRTKRVVVWYPHVYEESAAFIWCIWWTFELPLEVRQVVCVTRRLQDNLGEGV